jgi:hypothetical protein
VLLIDDDIIKAWHAILFLGIDESELRSRNTNVSFKEVLIPV